MGQSGRVSRILGAVIVCSFLWAISYPPSPRHAPRAEADKSSAYAKDQPIAPKSETETQRDEQERFEKAANERGLTIATWVLAFATVFLVSATGILDVGTFIAARAARDAAQHIPKSKRPIYLGMFCTTLIPLKKQLSFVYQTMKNTWTRSQNSFRFL